MWATSAGSKLSFAYDKLIEVLEWSIVSPKTAFCMGCDYRVPLLHGLLDRDFINKLKMSPTFNQETFGQEYLSYWLGTSEDSWFNFDKMMKYRKIKNPETHASNRGGKNSFYLLAVDVGRLGDQTVCCIFRVTVNNGRYIVVLVNLYVLGRQAETKTFHQQAIDIKKLIAAFQPKEVVIDTNGLGVGLADVMIQEQVDDLGNLYPAYGFFNDPNYKKVQPKTAMAILYGIKANGPLNSKIHSNVFSRVNSGLVKFLIKEQEAKSQLMATEVGQKMSIEKRVKRLLPHEMTTRLFEEMANLRLKKVGVDIALEQINPRFPKDKYSAFAYGLWRVKEMEEEAAKKNRRRFGENGRMRQLTFFTQGG